MKNIKHSKLIYSPKQGFFLPPSNPCFSAIEDSLQKFSRLKSLVNELAIQGIDRSKVERCGFYLYY